MIPPIGRRMTAAFFYTARLQQLIDEADQKTHRQIGQWQAQCQHEQHSEK